MAHDIGFYCGPDDIKKLLEYINSIGLYKIPLQANGEIGNPDTIHSMFLSPFKQEELVPYDNPPKIFLPSVNPVFRMRRPYYKDNTLVTGVITLEKSPKDFYVILKPYYMKICRWIRKHYEKRVDFYYGPVAQELIDQNGAEVTSARI